MTKRNHHDGHRRVSIASRLQHEQTGSAISPAVDGVDVRRDERLCEARHCGRLAARLPPSCRRGELSPPESPLLERAETRGARSP